MAKGKQVPSKLRSSESNIQPENRAEVKPVKFRLPAWARNGSISTGDHINHIFGLIREALKMNLEHGWYAVYDWALNFNALRRGKAMYQLSVYPQAKLVFDSSKKAVTGHGNKEFKDTYQSDDEDQGVEEAMRRASITASKNVESEDEEEEGGDREDGADESGGNEDGDGEGENEDGNNEDGDVEDEDNSEDSENGEEEYEDNSEDSEDGEEEHENILPRKNTRKKNTTVRPPDSNASSAASEKEKDTIRYPDFSISVTLPEMQAVGIHSLWELKNFPELRFIPLSERERYEWLKNRFVMMRPQILQQGVCAFSQFPLQNTLHVFCVVGYYILLQRLHRSNMPEVDFNYKGAPIRHIEAFMGPSGGSSMFHLFNDDKTDYSREFKRAWTRALSTAMTEISSASGGSANTGGTHDPTTQANPEFYGVPLPPNKKKVRGA